MLLRGGRTTEANRGRLGNDLMGVHENTTPELRAGFRFLVFTECGLAVCATAHFFLFSSHIRPVEGDRPGRGLEGFFNESITIFWVTGGSDALIEETRQTDGRTTEANHGRR